MKAVDAVEPLIRAADKQLPIKSRANSVRLAAIRALVKIGDPRAVPLLAKILTTSANEQDFLLNQKAPWAWPSCATRAASPSCSKACS